MQTNSEFSQMTRRFAGSQRLRSSGELTGKSPRGFAEFKQNNGPEGWSKKLGVDDRGSSPDDIKYASRKAPKFIRKSGTKLLQKDKNPNVNPLYTKVSGTTVYPLRRGDSIADVAAKLFNFIKKNNDAEHKKLEIDHNFRKEMEDSDKDRHEQLIKAIKKSYSRQGEGTGEGTGEKGEKGDKGSGTGGILGKIGEAIGGLAGWLGSAGLALLGIFKNISTILLTLTTSIIKPIAEILLTLTKDLLFKLVPKLLEIFGGAFKFVGEQLLNVLKPLFSMLSKGAGAAGELTAAALSAAAVPLVVGLIGTMIAKYGLQAILDANGGDEAVRTKIELGESGVVKNNGFNEESKVNDWEKISQQQATQLLKTGDFNEEDTKHLTAKSKGEEYNPKVAQASVSSELAQKSAAAEPSTMDNVKALGGHLKDMFMGETNKEFTTPPKPIETPKKDEPRTTTGGTAYKPYVEPTPTVTANVTATPTTIPVTPTVAANVTATPTITAPPQVTSNRNSELVQKTTDLNNNTIQQKKESSGKPVVMNNSTNKTINSGNSIDGGPTGPLTSRNDEFDYILKDSYMRGISGH